MYLPPQRAVSVATGTEEGEAITDQCGGRADEAWMPVGGGDETSSAGDGAMPEPRCTPSVAARAALSLHPRAGAASDGVSATSDDESTGLHSESDTLRTGSFGVRWRTYSSESGSAYGAACSPPPADPPLNAVRAPGSGADGLSETSTLDTSAGSVPRSDAEDLSACGAKVAELIAGDAFGETSLITGDQGRLSVRTASLRVRAPPK